MRFHNTDRPTCHLQPPKTLPSLRGAASCARYGETAPLVNLETVSGPIISISPLVTVNVRGGGGGEGGTTRGFPRRTVGSGFDARRCSIHHLRPLHFSLSLSLHELLSDRVLRKTEHVQEEDVQPGCFEQRDAPGRILALSLRVKSFGYPTSAGGDAREAGELQRAREKNLESTGLTIAD